MASWTAEDKLRHQTPVLEERTELTHNGARQDRQYLPEFQAIKEEKKKTEEIGFVNKMENPGLGERRQIESPYKSFCPPDRLGLSNNAGRYWA